MGTGKKAAQHHGMSSGAQSFGNISGKLDAPVGDDGYPGLFGNLLAVLYGGELGNPDACHDPGGADGPRPDTDLHSISPGIDQCKGPFFRGHIAGHHLCIGKMVLDLFHRIDHIFECPWRYR